MSMAYCHHCDTYYDTDYLDNYDVGDDGEFICEHCQEDSEACFEDSEEDFGPTEADEWQSFDPDC